MTERGDQFIAAGEDRVGVVQRDSAGLGELQAPSPAIEKRVPEAVLELADLHRKR